MDNILRVHVVDSEENLPHNLGCFGFLKRLDLLNSLEQFSTLAELADNMVVLVIM